jgi:hypothetical protein
MYEAPELNQIGFAGSVAVAVKKHSMAKRPQRTIEIIFQ